MELNVSEILKNLRHELTGMADEITRDSSRRYFKEEIALYGVKTALVGQLAKKYQPEISKLSKPEVFVLCEELFKADYSEEAYIACDWVYSRRKEYLPQDFQFFERWINQYIDNWAKCDTLCNHSLAAFIDLYPQFLAELKGWARNGNRWSKRAAAVTLIIPAREGRYLEDIFQIADILLMDTDDLVQKGYGWMLKAASQSHEKEVFEYILKHRAVMPRTALRYAIEKMAPELKKKAMEK
jgi:3-methyladenine DNA glycosylase AlkD